MQHYSVHSLKKKYRPCYRLNIQIGVGGENESKCGDELRMYVCGVGSWIASLLPSCPKCPTLSQTAVSLWHSSL